jgi:hypothetical protein
MVHTWSTILRADYGSLRLICHDVEYQRNCVEELMNFRVFLNLIIVNACHIQVYAEALSYMPYI